MISHEAGQELPEALLGPPKDISDQANTDADAVTMDTAPRAREDSDITMDKDCLHMSRPPCITEAETPATLEVGQLLDHDDSFCSSWHGRNFVKSTSMVHSSRIP